MLQSNLKRSIPGLGKRLVELRRRAGQTQVVLGVHSQLSTGVVVQAERNDLASTATLVKLARALGVTVDVLVGREPITNKIEAA